MPADTDDLQAGHSGAMAPQGIRQGGRPAIDPDVRELIRTMSRNNIGWGAPRIHGELQMLGVQLSESTVAKYMIRHPKPPSQTWKTFLANHTADLVSVDFFTVPTATFRIMYVFVILHHERREIVHFNATYHPTAEWAAQQIVEAFPFDTAPHYLIRDRDSIYGARFRNRVKSLGIEEVPTAPPALALAKPLCRANNWQHSARVPESRYHLK
jgi:hypothetical protein